MLWNIFQNSWLLILLNILICCNLIYHQIIIKLLLITQTNRTINWFKSKKILFMFKSTFIIFSNNSFICAGIFFSTAFDRGCFNTVRWKTNDNVLMSKPKDWLCTVVTVSYLTALFTPAVKLNILRLVSFCLGEYLCVFAVF